MLVASIPALVALAGVLMFALSANPKLVEIGKIMFAAGLLVCLLVVGHEAVKLFP